MSRICLAAIRTCWGEAVDRLLATAGKIIRASPEFRRLLEDAGTGVFSDRVVP